MDESKKFCELLQRENELLTQLVSLHQSTIRSLEAKLYTLPESPTSPESFSIHEVSDSHENENEPEVHEIPTLSPVPIETYEVATSSVSSDTVAPKETPDIPPISSKVSEIPTVSIVSKSGCLCRM